LKIKKIRLKQMSKFTVKGLILLAVFVLAIVFLVGGFSSKMESYNFISQPTVQKMPLGSYTVSPDVPSCGCKPGFSGKNFRFQYQGDNARFGNDFQVMDYNDSTLGIPIKSSGGCPTAGVLGVEGYNDNPYPTCTACGSGCNSRSESYVPDADRSGSGLVMNNRIGPKYQTTANPGGSLFCANSLPPRVHFAVNDMLGDNTKGIFNPDNMYQPDSCCSAGSVKYVPDMRGMATDSRLNTFRGGSSTSSAENYKSGGCNSCG
jgi:hypothetical protein